MRSFSRNVTHDQRPTGTEKSKKLKRATPIPSDACGVLGPVLVFHFLETRAREGRVKYLWFEHGELFEYTKGGSEWDAGANLSIKLHLDLAGVRLWRPHDRRLAGEDVEDSRTPDRMRVEGVNNGLTGE
jgi:hypothetical protein